MPNLLTVDTVYLIDPKLSSFLASLVMRSVWHQYPWQLNIAYMLLVMRWATGPISSNIDIILPMILASWRALRPCLPTALLSWSFSVQISHLAEGQVQNQAICSAEMAPKLCVPLALL